MLSIARHLADAASCGTIVHKELPIMSSIPSPRLSRRSLLLSSVPFALGPMVARAGAADAPTSSFPGQEPEMVREMVGVSHAQFARVKELVALHPALVKATYDWGFGDWESCIDAASHVGNREIAEFLLANGARPTIFSAAMLGHLDAVKAYIAAAPGIQKIKGPHSITLMRHAMAGGDRAKAVVEYLKTVEGADDRLPTQPLTAEDLAKLQGTYEKGVEIKVDREQLVFACAGRTPRLIHLGGYEFYPPGAEQVRIRFAASAVGVTLTVHDRDVVLTARRTS
jgi:hypothetical protein